MPRLSPLIRAVCLLVALGSVVGAGVALWGGHWLDALLLTDLALLAAYAALKGRDPVAPRS